MQKSPGLMIKILNINSEDRLIPHSESWVEYWDHHTLWRSLLMASLYHPTWPAGGSREQVKIRANANPPWISGFFSLMICHRKIKWTRWDSMGHQRPLCAHLYRDLSQPQHPGSNCCTRSEWRAGRGKHHPSTLTAFEHTHSSPLPVPGSERPPIATT